MFEVLCGFRCHVQNKVTQITWPKEEKTHYWIWLLLRWRISCWKHRHSHTQTTRVVYGYSSSQIYRDGARWCYRKWRQSRHQKWRQSRDQKWRQSRDRKWHHRKWYHRNQKWLCMHNRFPRFCSSYFISSTVVPLHMTDMATGSHPNGVLLCVCMPNRMLRNIHHSGAFWPEVTLWNVTRCDRRSRDPEGSGRERACATGSSAISALVGPFHRKWHHQP